jgi:hypothetical protein
MIVRVIIYKTTDNLIIFKITSNNYLGNVRLFSNSMSHNFGLRCCLYFMVVVFILWLVSYRLPCIVVVLNPAPRLGPYMCDYLRLLALTRYHQSQNKFLIPRIFVHFLNANKIFHIHLFYPILIDVVLYVLSHQKKHKVESVYVK